MKAGVEIGIRRGEKKDAGKIAPLAARTFYKVHAPLSSAKDCKAYVDEIFTTKTQEKEILDSKNVFFTAWAGKILAGYAKLKEATPDHPVGDKAICLQRLYLDNKWFGHGIGAKLMRECVEEAVQRGFETMWLQVHINNDRAVTFYKKWGFNIAALCYFEMGSQNNPNHLMTLALNNHKGNS